MYCGKKGVGDGVRMLVADGRYVLEPHPAILEFRGPVAAVYGNLVTACGQARGKFFREGLTATVAGGDAARADDCEPHRSEWPSGALRARACDCAGAGFWGRAAHGLEGKPTGEVVILRAPPLHDFAALRHRAFPVAQDKAKGLE